MISKQTQNASPYPNKLMGVTVSLITDQEKAINNQSLTTPTTFIVKAKVFSVSKKTARFGAKAQEELVPKKGDEIEMETWLSQNWELSKNLWHQQENKTAWCNIIQRSNRV